MFLILLFAICDNLFTENINQYFVPVRISTWIYKVVESSKQRSSKEQIKKKNNLSYIFLETENLACDVLMKNRKLDNINEQK